MRRKKGNVLVLVVVTILLIVAALFVLLRKPKLPQSIFPSRTEESTVNPSSSSTKASLAKPIYPTILATKSWQTYTNKDLDFTLKYPQDWDYLPQGTAGVMLAPRDRIAEAKKITGPHGGGKGDTMRIYVQPPTTFNMSAPETNQFFEVVNRKIGIDDSVATEYKEIFLQPSQGNFAPGDISLYTLLDRQGKRYLFLLVDDQFVNIYYSILSTFKFLTPEQAPVFKDGSITLKMRSPYSSYPEIMAANYTLTYNYRSGDEVLPIKPEGSVYFYNGIDITRGNVKLAIRVPFEGVQHLYSQIPEPVLISPVKFSNQAIYRVKNGVWPDLKFKPMGDIFRYVSHYGEGKDKCGEIYNEGSVPACSQSTADQLSITCSASASNVSTCDEIVKSFQVSSKEI